MINLGPLDLVVPPLMLVVAILYIPITILFILKDGKFLHLTSYRAFQQVWFERFFSVFGPASKPLFVSEVRGVLAKASGVVLDVGSGSGDWLEFLAPRHNDTISRVYLLEPNGNFHAKLRERAERVGLGGRYEVLDGGVEDLERLGVQPGSFDTVSTVHVLCSVGDQRSVVGSLYRFLKPGGKWLVYEHVAARREHTTAAVCQEITNAVWPALTDGCYLTRNTEDVLVNAGPWKSVDLRRGTNEGRFCQIPHTVGHLVKQ